MRIAQAIHEGEKHMKLRRGDVVIYKNHLSYNALLEGTLAVVLNHFPGNEPSVPSVYVQPIIINPEVITKPFIKQWCRQPYFQERNCVLIGHIELDPDS
jgi:hypothetical protein